MNSKENWNGRSDNIRSLRVLFNIDFDSVAPAEAADAFLDLLSSDARVLYEGKIIRTTDLNVRPNTAINRAVARGLVHETIASLQGGLSSHANLAVVAVENSAPYLAFAYAEELERRLGMRNIPIDRVRKGNFPSALLYPSRTETVEIQPITATDGLPRYLHAEIPEAQDADIAIIIDDVTATGSSMDGATKLARRMYPDAVVARCTVFAKVEQHEPGCGSNDYIDISLVNIEHFGWDAKKGQAVLQVANHTPRILQRAKSQDFIKKN